MDNTNTHLIDPHSLTPEQAGRLLHLPESFLAYLAGTHRKRLLDIRKKSVAQETLTPAERGTVEKLAPYMALLPRLCQALRDHPNAALASEDQELLECMWDLLAAMPNANACTGLFGIFLVQQGYDWVSSESVSPIRLLNQRFNRLLSPSDWVARLTRVSNKPQERQVTHPALFRWPLPRKAPPLQLKDAGDHQTLHQVHPGRHRHASVAFVSPLLIGRYPRLWPSDMAHGPNGLLPCLMMVQPSGLGPPIGAWDRREYHEWCDYRKKIALERKLRLGRTPGILMKPHRVSWLWKFPPTSGSALSNGQERGAA